MGYIGTKPSAVPLTSADITDGIITSAKITDATIVNGDIANATIALAKLSATGTASASTFLRGDNSWGSAGASAGQVIQVLGATDSTYRSTTGTTFVTGSNTLSVTITPSSASNKILILVSAAITQDGGRDGYWTIFRGGTNLGPANGLAHAQDGSSGSIFNMGINYLDSPSTTSATTYQVYLRCGSLGNTAQMNTGSTRGSMTCLEIKG